MTSRWRATSREQVFGGVLRHAHGLPATLRSGGSSNHTHLPVRRATDAPPEGELVDDPQPPAADVGRAGCAHDGQRRAAVVDLDPDRVGADGDRTTTSLPPWRTPFVTSSLMRSSAVSCTDGSHQRASVPWVIGREARTLSSALGSAWRAVRSARSAAATSVPRSRMAPASEPDRDVLGERSDRADLGQAAGVTWLAGSDEVRANAADQGAAGAGPARPPARRAATGRATRDPRPSCPHRPAELLDGRRLTDEHDVGLAGEGEPDEQPVVGVVVGDGDSQRHRPVSRAA